MSREVAVNKAITARELREVLRADFEKLLNAEGLLSGPMAYGRIGYELILRLHTANVMRPESETIIESRPIGTNLLEAMPEMAAIEKAPLATPVEDDTVSGTTLSRNISSPNAERVRLGLPVPVERRQMNASVSTENIIYPPQPELGEGDVRVTDSSAEARHKWNLPDVVPAEIESDGDPT